MKKKTVERRKKKRLKNSDGGKNSKYAQKKSMQGNGVFSSTSPYITNKNL